MTKIGLFPHNGSANHGCEAIVRSTVDLLDNIGCPIVFSERLSEDRQYLQDLKIECRSPKKEITRFTGPYFLAMFQKHIERKKNAFERVTFDPLIKTCRNGIFLSIGGDLYCYDPPDYLYRIHRYLSDVGAKCILWGCSVEPERIDEQMKKDLASYDLICSRESISYEKLKEINPRTVLTIDPSFTLPTQAIDLPGSDYIGINISPMVIDYEHIPGITLKNYARLIRHVLRSTDSIVALIPHVVWSNTDDRAAIAALNESFSNEPRVVVIGDMNCMQLKHIISHCRMFIGARTHATIAAYSSCVPTLTIGYSVKAKGIAKDLFGTYENYVLPVQSLKTPDDITNAFIWMAERENEIRAHLQRIMPEYKSRINVAVEAVKNLVNRHD